MPAPSRTVLVALALASALAASAGSHALAQRAPRSAARRALIDRAQSACDHGDHALAVELAERAGAIRMTPSLRLFIALEREELGQYVEALEGADLCVREAERDTTAHHRALAARECRALAARVEQRVGYVRVHAPPSADASLEVTVAGRPLERAYWGARYAVAPGEVEVTARSADGREWRTVHVAPGAVVDVGLAGRVPSRNVGGGPVADAQLAGESVDGRDGGT